MPLTIFISILVILFLCLLVWSFKNLPNEGWQIMASIPIQKLDSGKWRGITLTYYGVFISISVAVSISLFFIMMGSIGIGPYKIGILSILIIFLFLPSSRLLARIVEKKQNTFTVGGASFAAILAIPVIISILRYLDPGDSYGLCFPVIPTLSALSVCYTIGEGLGRLACISFGCCYGPKLSECSPLIRKIFARHNFIFTGPTKKISYASGAELTPVVPIQAITSSLYVFTGLLALCLWFQNFQSLSLYICIMVTQGWRFLSEFLRSDFRGFRNISAYQVMALVSIAYIFVLVSFLPQGPMSEIDLIKGLDNWLDPFVILLIQSLGIVVFLFTGVSSVIGSFVSFYVHSDKI